MKNHDIEKTNIFTVVAFEGCHGFYIGSNPNGYSYCGAPRHNQWEHYTIVKSQCTDNSYAIRSFHGQYFTAREAAKDLNVVCDQTSIKQTESWNMIIINDQ